MNVPYNKMTAEEMDAEVAKFDRPNPSLRGKPLSKKQHAQHRHAKRRMGRPVVGKGSMRISITMERGLLKAVDEHAAKSNATRSALISEGVRAVLKAG
jgi:hypothetical protein